MEEFVCAMYGKPKLKDVNLAQFELFQEKHTPKDKETLLTYDGADLSLLPPDRACLRLHTARANRQAYSWKHAHQAEQNLPSPVCAGWIVKDGHLKCDWTPSKIFPQEVVDILVPRQVQQSKH